MSGGPQRTSGAIREPQESAHMEEKHTPATHLMVGEDSPSKEQWEFGTETKKVSNGEVVRLQTGRLTPASFYEAVETLTVSVSTRTQNWIETREKNSQHGVAPHED